MSASSYSSLPLDDNSYATIEERRNKRKKGVNIMKSNMSTREDLFDMLEEKEREIKTLRLEINMMKNKTWQNKKMVREDYQWTGEEISFADSINNFCRDLCFQSTSSSRKDGRNIFWKRKIASPHCACNTSRSLKAWRRQMYGRELLCHQ